MKTLRFFILITCFVATSFGAWAEVVRPHLYKVTYGGVESYLFGTIHLGVGLEDLPPVVMQKLATTDQAFFEMSLQAMKDAVNDPGIKSLPRNLDLVVAVNELKSSREKALYQKMIESGTPEAVALFYALDSRQAEKYSASSLLYMPYLYLSKFMLDAQIAIEIEHLKGPLYSFRKIETDALVNASKMAESQALQRFQQTDKGPSILTLEQWLATDPLIFTHMPEVVKSYEEGIVKTEKEFQFSGSDYGVAIRNANWIMQIVPELRARRTAVVVGRDHLYGSKGLIKNLRRFGFTVERVE